MKFSIFMMPLHYPTENPSLAFDRDIALIEYADELGYDEFFIGEHHSGGWETMPAPEMALAKASARAFTSMKQTRPVGDLAMRSISPIGVRIRRARMR